jgi:hypothetical protein
LWDEDDDLAIATTTVREGVFGFAATTAPFAVLGFGAPALTFEAPPTGFFAAEDFREADFATVLPLSFR